MGNIINKFSVVIPTLWKSDKIFKMLDIYEKSEYVSEVIVIDNDPTRNRILKHSKVKTVTKGHNIFVNPAWNWGVSLSSNENIIIANDDIIIENLDDLLIKFNDSNFDLVGVDWDNTRCDGDIKIIESEKLQYGYGCFMFVKKSKYIQIPYDLKIWRGDFLLHKHLTSGKFSGVFLDTIMSESVNMFKHVARKDTIAYREWKRYRKEVTIIIENNNPLRVLQRCIDSFTSNIRMSYFLIVIDNTQNNGVKNYMESLDKANTMIILNDMPLSTDECFDMCMTLAIQPTKYILCQSSFIFKINSFTGLHTNNKIFLS